MGRIAGEVRIKFRVKQSGCWIWEGKIGKRGYGVVSRQKSSRYAHVRMYELFKGIVPAGKELHHLCLNKSCVNPEHLVPVTRKEHVALSPGNVGYINGKKSHCPKGHELSLDEGYFNKTGRSRRYCRTCRLESIRKSNAARRASRLSPAK